MTIKEFLINKANEFIAKEIWRNLGTELDRKINGELADEHVRFPWIVKRAMELAEEYTEKPVKKKSKEVADEEKAEN